MQLHPGDIGWHHRFGAAGTAQVIRTWSRDGRIVAVGMLDSPRLLRMTVAPDAFEDEDVARRLVEDLSLPERGVLPEGAVSVEAPLGLLLHDLLSEEEWGVDAPWTPSSATSPSRFRTPAYGSNRSAGTRPRTSPTSCGRRSTPPGPRASTGTRWRRPLLRRRPLPGRLRRPGRRGGGGDGVVSRPGQTGAGRTDGRPRQPPGPGLRPGDHAGRGGRTAGNGLVQRPRVHTERQRGRRGHLQGGGVRGSQGGTGPGSSGVRVGGLVRQGA